MWDHKLCSLSIVKQTNLRQQMNQPHFYFQEIFHFIVRFALSLFIHLCCQFSSSSRLVLSHWIILILSIKQNEQISLATQQNCMMFIRHFQKKIHISCSQFRFLWLCHKFLTLEPKLSFEFCRPLKFHVLAESQKFAFCQSSSILACSKCQKHVRTRDWPWLIFGGKVDHAIRITQKALHRGAPTLKLPKTAIFNYFEHFLYM